MPIQNTKTPSSPPPIIPHTHAHQIQSRQSILRMRQTVSTWGGGRCAMALLKAPAPVLPCLGLRELASSSLRSWVLWVPALPPGQEGTAPLAFLLGQFIHARHRGYLISRRGRAWAAPSTLVTLTDSREETEARGVVLEGKSSFGC